MRRRDKLYLRSLSIGRRVRGFVLALRIRAFGGHVGAGLMADRGVHLRRPPTRRWRIGTQVYLARNVIIDVTTDATFSIGNRTKLMHHVVIGAAEHVSIGNDSQVAECSTVRDADHGIDDPGPITSAPLVTAPVTIGDDVWIGRGVAVLAGSDIADGVVVGANSTVKGRLPAGAVALGSPASVRRYRGRPASSEPGSTVRPNSG